MHFLPESIYHIYNRGNQKQIIFKSRDHYLYFLEKVNNYIKPRCKILARCLMPNHFHFLVYTTLDSAEPLPKSIIPTQYLTEGIRLLLSSYTKGFNKQMKLSGNLFQQKTRAKLVIDETGNYGLSAFNYIHQNPWRAGLVSKVEDWEFSSFIDYLGARNGKLCERELAKELLDLDQEKFYAESYGVLPDNINSKIF